MVIVTSKQMSDEINTSLKESVIGAVNKATADITQKITG